MNDDKHYPCPRCGYCLQWAHHQFHIVFWCARCNAIYRPAEIMQKDVKVCDG